MTADGVFETTPLLSFKNGKGTEMPSWLMNSALEQVKDWAALAKHAGYCAAALAEICHISSRQLERFFRAKMGDTPHHWLRKLRMSRAVELIRDGAAMKEVASELCYKDPAHFSHDFKEYFGITPTQCAGNASGGEYKRKLGGHRL